MIDLASIKKEVRDWSKEVLETEQPICPYAKKNMARKKSRCCCI